MKCPSTVKIHSSLTLPSYCCLIAPSKGWPKDPHHICLFALLSGTHGPPRFCRRGENWKIMLLRAKTRSDFYLLPTSHWPELYPVVPNYPQGSMGNMVFLCALKVMVLHCLCLLRWVATVLRGRGDMVSMSRMPDPEIIICN